MIKQGESFSALFRACLDSGGVKDDLTHSTGGLSIVVCRTGFSTLSFSGFSTKSAPQDSHSEGAIYNYGGGIYSVDLPSGASSDFACDVFVKGTFTGGYIEPMGTYPVAKYDRTDVNLGMTPGDFKADVTGLASTLADLDAIISGKLDTLFESDGSGGWEFTTASLVNAPIGFSSADRTKLDAVKAVTDVYAGMQSGGVFTAPALANSPVGFGSSDRTLLTGISDALPANFADLGIEAGTGKISSVALVDVCTNNTDMRGTDNAPTAEEIRIEVDANSTRLSAIAGVTTKVNDLLSYDGVDSKWQFTANALELMSSGFTSADRTKLNSVESRLTADRAGYLDNLNGHVAQTGDAFERLATYKLGQLLSSPLVSMDSDSLFGELTVDDAGVRKFTANALEEVDPGFTTEDRTKLTALEDRLTVERASNLDNLDGHVPQTGDVFAGLPDNFGELGINASGHILNVATVATCQANSDMRGTDGAYTGTPPTVTQITSDLDENSTLLTQIAANAATVAGLVSEGSFTSTALQNAPVASEVFTSSDRSNLNSLVSRLTAARAGYLDNLGGHVPQTGDAYLRLAEYKLGQFFVESASSFGAGSLFEEMTEDDAGVRRFKANALELGPIGSGTFGDSDRTKLTDLVNRLTSTRAGYLDNLNGHTPQTGDVYGALPGNFSTLLVNPSGHIERVTLVDTCSANSDMRGTDGAYSGTPPTASEIVTEMDSNSTRLADIETASVLVADLVDSGSFTAIALQNAPVASQVFTSADRTKLEALETRLTTARAGYLDSLNGHVAQTGDVYVKLPANFEDLSIEDTTGKIVGVKLVDTCSVNSDMRGTDSAYTGTPTEPPTTVEIVNAMDSTSVKLGAIEAETDKLSTSLVDDGEGGYQWTTKSIENAPIGFGSSDRTKLGNLDSRLTNVRAGYLDNLNGHTPQTGDTFAKIPTNFEDLRIDFSGAVEEVNLVGVCTENTDMRGTDSAYTGSPPSVGDIVSGIEAGSKLSNADEVATRVNALIEDSDGDRFTPKALEAAPTATDPDSLGEPGGYATTINIGAANIDVWVTSDKAGTEVIDRDITKDDGSCVMVLLHGGTYYLWTRGAGYVNKEGEKFIATADNPPS